MQRDVLMVPIELEVRIEESLECVSVPHASRFSLFAAGSPMLDRLICSVPLVPSRLGAADGAGADELAGEEAADDPNKRKTGVGPNN